jgi:Tol biopolymer transport system component
MAAGPAESWPAKRDALVKRRITHATGFDGLPAFSSDGSWLIFTSQRAGPRPGEQRPTSQVWAARWSVEGK